MHNCLKLDAVVTDTNFDERAYLVAHPDVADAVAAGTVLSGWRHFEAYGQSEGRQFCFSDGIDSLRRAKMEKIKPLLRQDLPHAVRGLKYDYLTDELREATGIVDTEAVSSNEYDCNVLKLIYEFTDGLILDCGAGRRSVYYSNVLNYEIVDYDTTDIVGVGEVLPFVDNSFAAVISLAVLEHVRDPFKCASEIARVLKPGGKLLCCVPFLQPLHGYPHHYYNMTSQGLRALFDRHLEIDDHKVVESTLPIWALTWIVSSWAEGLKGKTLDDFLSLTLRELAIDPAELLARNWIKELPVEKNFELACGTLLFAHKAE